MSTHPATIKSDARLHSVLVSATLRDRVAAGLMERWSITEGLRVIDVDVECWPRTIARVGKGRQDGKKIEPKEAGKE
jgi:hypothetical protein